LQTGPWAGCDPKVPVTWPGPNAGRGPSAAVYVQGRPSAAGSVILSCPARHGVLRLRKNPPQCHAEAGSLTPPDEPAWQADASVPGVPRRILPCGDFVAVTRRGVSLVVNPLSGNSPATDPSAWATLLVKCVTGPGLRVTLAGFLAAPMPPRRHRGLRMTAARRARRGFPGSGYASQPAPRRAASDEVPAEGRIRPGVAARDPRFCTGSYPSIGAAAAHSVRSAVARRAGSARCGGLKW